METFSGEEIRAIAMMGGLFCLLPMGLMLLVSLPVLVWRRLVVSRRRRGTIEGDLAHLVSQQRGRERHEGPYST